MGKYLTKDNLLFSAVFGRGLYQWDGKRIAGPLGRSDKDPVSPVITDIATGETYFTMRLAGNGNGLTRCQAFIMAPPEEASILWPSDAIYVPKAIADSFRLFVDREYTEVMTPSEQRKGEIVLLFPCGKYPAATDGVSKLGQIRRPSWKNPEIRRMAAGIVRGLERLNRCGYAYGDMHLSRFFFLEDGSVFLDYSNLIYPLDSSSAYACAPPAGAYPIEFADPAYVRGIQKTLDFNSQNYSLCAMLFYLFFGRCPYDGRLLSGYIDSEAQEHYTKFRDYHKMPVFIFDPTDHQNALGAFRGEQPVINLWRELPEEMKQLFTVTLSEKNALRAGSVRNPPPVTWLRQFWQAGWVDNGDR